MNHVTIRDRIEKWCGKLKIFCAGCGENITALRVDHTLVTLAFKTCIMLPKTGNTNQIALLQLLNFCDICFRLFEFFIRKIVPRRYSFVQISIVIEPEVVNLFTRARFKIDCIPLGTGV